MPQDRKNAVFMNMAVTVVYQVVFIAVGFVVPQMFLTKYGPEIHGVTSFITDIMSYVALFNAGLGAAAIQSLYKPLAQNDHESLSAAIKAIDRSYIQVGVAYCTAVVLISFGLPLFVKDVPQVTVSLLMIVMGLTSTMECFIYSKHRTLLLADQKLYVANIVDIFAVLLRAVFQILMIKLDFSVVLVQALPAALVFFRMICVSLYVKKHYPYIKKNVKPDMSAVGKRWSALVHQIAGLVVNHTDNLYITVILGNMVLVSIYSVYNYLVSNLNSLLNMLLSTSTVASFGQIINIDIKKTREKFFVYEFASYGMISVAYSVCGVMLLQFVDLYTRNNPEGINYQNSWYAFLFIAIGVLNIMRTPSITLILAAGHFKETKNRAVIEAVINLTASLVLIWSMGIYGVLLGTVLSYMYRSVDTLIYTNKHILSQKPFLSFFRVIKMITVIFLNCLIFSKFHIISAAGSWLGWLLNAVIVGVVSLAVALAVNLATEPKPFINMVRMGMNVLPIGRKKGA